MKCPYCGGEVSFQNEKCPYCGRENAEGILFQKEIKQKIERNRLLKPFLIKQKTPELVQRMLTRILFVVSGVNLLLFVCCISFYVWSERDSRRVPAAESHAESFAGSLRNGTEYYTETFFEEMNAFMDAMESGSIPNRNSLSFLVEYGYRAMRETAINSDADEETQLLIRAFFCGYIGISEEDAAFLDAAKAEDAPYTPPDELVEMAVSAIEKRVKEDIS